MGYISRSINNVKDEIENLNINLFNEEEIIKIVENSYSSYNFFKNEAEIIEEIKEENDSNNLGYSDIEIENIFSYDTDNGSFTAHWKNTEDAEISPEAKSLWIPTAKVRIVEYAMDSGVNEEDYKFIVYVTVD